VLVVHEWWGLNDYAKARARQLAEQGYVALAIDMYGDGKTADHPKEAGKFAQEALANLKSAEARFLAGMKILQNDPHTNKDQIAAIGYCFGGGFSNISSARETSFFRRTL
jgi:dienelactone hydrolase